MKIKFKKKFIKQYKKFSPKIQKKIDQTIFKFQKNPHKESLENHALLGKYKSQRSISAGGDLRLIFSEEKNYITVEFLQTGTHAQLY